MTQDRAGDGSVALRLALFASILSAMLMAAMLVLRTGLPTPLGAVALGPAIAGLATLGPALWANRRGLRGEVWLGPIAVLMLIAGCLIAACGIVGQVLLWIAFLAVLARTILVLRQSGTTPGGRLALWLLLLLLATALAVLLTAGIKYVNFIADQLLLYGRTDGDVMFHGAIVNAIRNFGMPSTGIDGVHLLRYHTGFDALAALIARGGEIDAVLALIILRATILLPLSVFAFGWAALVYGRLLLPALTLRPLALATAAVIIGLLLQTGFFGSLILHNDPLVLSGLLLTLFAPAVLTDLIERGAGARAAMVAGAIAVPLLCLAKISTGAVWCALVGYMVLRLVGPRRIGFWVTGVAMTVLFGACTWLGNDPAQSGATWFGTPFFVAYGFKQGNYLLPLTAHAYLIVVMAALVRLRSAMPAAPRRWIIEALLVASVAADVPPLILEIEGGDAGFFLAAANWLMAPFLAMLIAALPHIVGSAQPRGRRLAQGALAVLLLTVTIDGALRSDDRFNVAVSGAALVHTGDLTYYADDKRRVWRADTKRALREHGLLGLFRLPPPPPTGAALADALMTVRAGASRIAAYIPPQSDYWNFVNDCDGRSLWPMAASGVPLIDGTVPSQAECPQDFALLGYGVPPETRSALAEPELCRRALAAGFPMVVQIGSLEERAKDNVTVCR